MIRVICASFGLLLASPVWAPPALFQVVNVDAHDVLNIRATPSPTAAITGELRPGARSVEVLETRHGWGRILHGESSGWISLAYLDPMERPVVSGFQAPAGFTCAGTEPFWGLSVAPDGELVRHDMLTLGEERMSRITDARRARGRQEPFIYHFAGEGSGMLLVRSGQCSDGMSERAYGWQAVLDVRDEDGARLMEGCCWTEIEAR